MYKYNVIVFFKIIKILKNFLLVDRLKTFKIFKNNLFV